GLAMLAELAVELGQQALPDSLRRRATRIREHVRQDWWLPEEGLFGDLRASRAELEALLARLLASDDLDGSVTLSIARLQEALASDAASVPNDLRRPWRLHY